MNADRMNQLLGLVVDLLDIPASHYAKAKERYESLGRWLHRDGSPVGALSPAVYPQGSFRLGTVIRPLLKREEYDLDLVCEITLSKINTTQKRVKELVGGEVKSYADAHGIKEPVAEGNRCWRLDYADDVRFHEDVLPAIPEDQAVKAVLCGRGVSASIVGHSICITDRRHPRFAVITPDWLLSNPRGYALWFEDRMRPAARPVLESLVRNRVYASVDDVPAYEWRTPLQRAVQLLKRHRDVMFKDDPECKPISIIITTLAARAYAGETDLHATLKSVVEQMPRLVNNRPPRVPNPVNPAEDFADKWAKSPRLERNFERWCAQLQTDLRRLRELASVGETRESIECVFGALVAVDELQSLGLGSAETGAGQRAPSVVIKDAPRPWKRID